MEKRILSLALNMAITALVFIAPQVGQCQLRANVWYFGNHAGLDFSCAPPVPITSAMDDLEGCATICDADGGLVMYTDGDTVWNAAHEVLVNGTGLAAHCAAFGNVSSSQSAVIVPWPGMAALYYIFTTDCNEDGNVDGLRYSVVDMSMNGGQGAVTLKNQLLFAPACEKVAAVSAADGTGTWVVGHEVGNNTFRAYRVDAAGLNTDAVVSSAGLLPTGSGQSTRGYLKFAPDGQRLLNISTGLATELFSFDAVVGTITSVLAFNIPDGTYYYGGSFSPNGQVVYLNGSNFEGATGLDQYDLNAGTAADILASKVDVYDCSSGQGCPYGTLQLGPDGKLYTGMSGIPIDGVNVKAMGVIEQPDLTGPGCDFEPYAIHLLCHTAAQNGLPNFIESYFLTGVAGASCAAPTADFSYTVDGSDPLLFHFQPSSFFLPTMQYGFLWDFGDGSTSTEEDPSHAFSVAGDHTVTLTIDDGCTPASSQQAVHVSAVGIAEQDGAGGQELHALIEPQNDQIQLSLTGDTQGMVTITLMNTLGQALRQVTMRKFRHELTTALDMRATGPGIYLLSVELNGGRLVQRVAYFR